MPSITIRWLITGLHKIAWVSREDFIDWQTTVTSVVNKADSTKEMKAVSDAMTHNFSHAPSENPISILITDTNTDRQDRLGNAFGCLSGRDGEEGACRLPALGTELAVRPREEAG
jgi:hypothetical protein